MNYTVCNKDTLCAHLTVWLPTGAFVKDDCGNHHAKVPSWIVREEVDAYIDACNKERTTSDGYERAEDFDDEKDTIVFYVMREDGHTMCELPVIFDAEAHEDPPSSPHLTHNTTEKE